MNEKLTARDIGEPAEALEEILSAPSARVVDEHGHEAALSGPLAGFFRTAVTAARGGGALLFSQDETMSPSEAAEVLGVSRPMVYRYIEEGLLEDQPVNTHHRIPAASVHQLAEERRGSAERAARLLREDPQHPRAAAARERVRARRQTRGT